MFPYNLFVLYDMNSKCDLMLDYGNNTRYSQICNICLRIPGILSLLFILPVFLSTILYVKLLWALTTFFSFMCDFYSVGIDSHWLALDRLWAKLFCVYIFINLIIMNDIHLFCISVLAIFYYFLSCYASNKGFRTDYIIYHSMWHILGAYIGINII